MKGDFSRQTFTPRRHYSGVLMQQGRVQLDADWNEQQAIQQHRIQTETVDLVGACGAPGHNAGFEITTENGVQWFIGPGRYYVDGLLCENEAKIAFEAQPDLPALPHPLTSLRQANTTLGLVYLDVWERHVTALDDPRLREVALNGPDTTTRKKTVWQVKLLPVAASGPGADPPSCAGEFPEWNRLIAPSTGTLDARTQPPAPTESLCLLPPTAGYQRLENQLYRVEIHEVSTPGPAKFKWSRDNGAMAAAVVGTINGKEITVQSVGPDGISEFANGQWVELTDDHEELNGEPGQILQIDKVDAATRVITVKTAPTAIDPQAHPKLRRWDSDGLQNVELPATNDGWIPLEGGIEIRFATGVEYRSGDYWLIPARTATGEIEWPPDPTPGASGPQLPVGIRHHYCRLALLHWDDKATAPPTAPPAATPAPPPSPGTTAPSTAPPVLQQMGIAAEDLQAFQVQIQPGVMETLVAQKTAGRAAFSRKLAAAQREAAINPVTAPGRPVIPPPGTTSSAPVPWHIEDCRRVFPPLTELPSPAKNDREPGIQIAAIALTQKPAAQAGILANDATIPMNLFVGGLTVRCQLPPGLQGVGIAPESISPATVFVTLEIPYQVNKDGVPQWGGTPIGFQPLVLLGTPTVAPDGVEINWVPDAGTAQWLTQMLPRVLFLLKPERVLARVKLKGSFIRTNKDPVLYLDGETWGTASGTTASNLQLPSGDGRRGGDFEMWFWLTPPQPGPTPAPTPKAQREQTLNQKIPPEALLKEEQQTGFTETIPLTKSQILTDIPSSAAEQKIQPEEAAPSVTPLRRKPTRPAQQTRNLTRKQIEDGEVDA